MNCYILFGCPGCGKSYYIKSKQLYSNTICYDKIRHKYNEINNEKIYEKFYKQIETYLKNNKNDLYIDMYNSIIKLKDILKNNYKFIEIKENDNE